jgi:hypothetical protein
MYSALTAYLAASFKGHNEKVANRLEIMAARRDTYLGIEALNEQVSLTEASIYYKRFGAVI